MIWAAFSNTRARGLDLARQAIKDCPAPGGAVALTRVRFASLRSESRPGACLLHQQILLCSQTVLKAPVDPQQCLGATAATILWIADGAGAGVWTRHSHFGGPPNGGTSRGTPPRCSAINILDEKHVPAILARADGFGRAARRPPRCDTFTWISRAGETQQSRQRSRRCSQAGRTRSSTRFPGAWTKADHCCVWRRTVWRASRPGRAAIN